MKDLIYKFKNVRLLRNLSWIFFGNVLYSLFKFLLDAFVARMLSLNDNGMLGYATSLIEVATAISGFGFASIITREFVENDEKAGQTLCSCILTQSGAAVVAIAVLQVIVRLSAPNEPELYPIVLLQSTSALFGSMSLFVYWFRYKNKADLVAILRLIAFGLTALWRIAALYFFNSLFAYTCGLAAESLLFGAFLAVFFFKNYKGKFQYSFNLVKKILRSSYPFIFSALLVTVYSQTDKIMLKSMMDNEAVALYNASLRLACALSMIPSSLIEGFRPEVMETKYTNEVLYYKRFRQLYAIVFWFSAAYGVFVTIFAKPIILLLYGEKYLGAVGSLSLVVWYSAFSYFGAINNMYMVAEYKSKWVQITTLAGAVCNVVLNLAMIPLLGIIGAALASLLTQFVANFLFMWVVKDLRPGFRNMLRGIALRDVR